MNQNASFFVKLEPKVRCKLPPPIRRSAAFLHPRRAGLWLLEFRLEGSPSGRPCRSYGARLLRAGASEGPASPGLAGGALLSRDGVARRLRESAQLLRTRSATLPRPVAGNGVQGGGLRALW